MCFERFFTLFLHACCTFERNSFVSKQYIGLAIFVKGKMVFSTRNLNAITLAVQNKHYFQITFSVVCSLM